MRSALILEKENIFKHQTMNKQLFPCLAFLLLILLFILICFKDSYSQSSINNLNNRLDSLFTSDFFKTAQIALDVYDLSNNKPILFKNEKLLLRPASVEKILTTSAALKFLGTDYNFTTKIFHTGEVDDSICSGDLFIVGGFDPDFTSRDLDSMVSEIKNYGIKEIQGNLYADISASDSLFWGEGWMWDDDPGTFAAYLSPLNINDNSISIIYEPDIAGNPANVELLPQNNFIKIQNYSTTIDAGKTSISVTRDWINRNNTIIIKGEISSTASRDTVSVNIFNPAYYFLNLMKESMERHRIMLKGKTDTLALKTDAEEIFTFERNLEPVLINTNKTSDNLNAEMILRAIASKNFPKPATAVNGIKLIDSLITLIGFDPKNYRIVDGSGLSFYNLVSAELITGLLKYIYYEEEDTFVKLYNTFPISGFDGTLERRMKESRTEKRVRAKTGTLNGVSNLAGYLHTQNGNILAFSIFIQNYVVNSNQARRYQDKICEILFEEL